MLYKREGKVWGYIREDTLYKVIKGSRHLLWSENSLCFDVGMLKYCREKGVKRIEIFDKESGKIYVGFLDDILRYGKRIDFGYGEQVAVPVERLKIYEQGRLF